MRKRIQMIIVILIMICLGLIYFDIALYVSVKKAGTIMESKQCIDAFVDYRCIGETAGHSYCEGLAVDSEKENCHWEIDTYYLDNGTNSMDIRYCKKIRSSDIKNACFSVINKDVEQCKNVKDKHSRLFCMIQLGEIKNNLSLCKELVDEELIKECEDYFKSFRGD
jgi:hypothetical protein